MEAIRFRQSIRKYKRLAVTDGQVALLMEAARLAPSGSNTQPWVFIIIRDDQVRQAVAAVCQQEWMLTAPLFIACVADMQTRVKDRMVEVDEDSPLLDLKRIIRDTTIAIEHIVLQAASIGLSSCWVAYFTQAKLRPVLGIPSDKYVVAVLTIGHAAETPERRARKSIRDFTYMNVWGNQTDPGAGCDAAPP
jgi:nitroreductase